MSVRHNPPSGQAYMIPKSFPELAQIPRDVEVPVISLAGPFLPESYAIRNVIECRSYLNLLSKCNLTICRDLIVLTQDMTYDLRDNIRLELGLTHHIHAIEIKQIDDDIRVIGIDKFILVNPDDAEHLQQYIKSFPLSTTELKQGQVSQCKSAASTRN